MEQFFDLIGGLPLHPLSVHAASVLIPLSALALLVLALVPRWRKSYLLPTVGALGVSVVLSFIAKESGEALSARVGTPAEHQALGDILLPASIGLLALGVALYFLNKSNTPRWTLQVASGFASVAVVGVVVLSVLVGHSGAEATWGNRLAATQAQELQPPAGSDQGSIADSGITVAEVLSHNSASDCWSVIDGNVYDLTSYVSTHKGGAGVIEAICGKDGTKAFSGEHAGAPAPATDLSSLLVGPLGVASASGETSMPTDSVYTAAEIQNHNKSTDCWSVINGEVYDLTSYVKDHPGGASLIAAICGKDGSAAFSGEHAGEKQPKNILAAFAVGTLVSGTTLPEAVVQYDDDDDEDEDEDDDEDEYEDED